MTDEQAENVTFTRDDPTLDAVLDEMEIGRCYVTADLVAEFDHLDVSRWTVRNRLLDLADEGRIERRKHTNDAVTYRRLPPTEAETETETEAAGGDD